MHKKSFAIVMIVVTLFLAFMLGYSIPPYIHAGVFSEREEKGVAVEIDQNMEQYYQDLYSGGEEE
ncbi:MAG: hypothetical protein P8Y85_05805 [Nitrospirota bacterium]|jgi:hypothetical protein